MAKDQESKNATKRVQTAMESFFTQHRGMNLYVKKYPNNVQMSNQKPHKRDNDGLRKLNTGRETIKLFIQQGQNSQIMLAKLIETEEGKLVFEKHALDKYNDLLPSTF
jgi:hypothetical protein